MLPFVIIKTMLLLELLEESIGWTCGITACSPCEISKGGSSQTCKRVHYVLFASMLFSATKIGYSSRAIFLLIQAMDKVKLLENSLKMYKIQRRLSRAGNVSPEQLEKIIREADTPKGSKTGKQKKKSSKQGCFEFQFLRRERIQRDPRISWEPNPLDKKSGRQPRKIQL